MTRDEEERETVNGMVEERTSNASAWPGLVDDIVAYGDGIRRQAIEECGKALGEEAVRMMGTSDEREDAQTVARCSMLVRKLAWLPNSKAETPNE